MDVVAVGREWSQRGLFTMREMLPLMRTVTMFDGWTDEQRHTLILLASATARSSESVFLLTAYGQLWDAEMVLRSVIEGTLKFAFLLESRAEFDGRHTEYGDNLFEIALLKDHQKAKDFLDGAADPSAAEWRPIRERVLPAAEYEELRAKYDKKHRSDLEAKWGFTTLLNAVGRRKDASFRELSGLAWSYSLMSHLQHADYLGISLPMDRERRAETRRDSMHLAHHARLVNDTLVAMLNRLTIGYLCVGADLRPVSEALAKINSVREGFGGAYDQWLAVEYGVEQKAPTAEIDPPP